MSVRSLLLLAILVVIPNLALADPLFESDEALELDLEGPFGLMNEDRDKEKTWPGVLSGQVGRFDVALSHRGNRRLDKEVCDYPPLRLDFKKKQIKSTVFAHQNDIKLVVQCDDKSVYADYVRLEYLIYKALNLLTPASYKVRWVDMRFIDPAAKPGKQVRNMPAFFVERKSRIARRLGLEKTDIASISVSMLVPEQAALLGLFQYVIANPDYSLAAAPPGDSCCHNAKLLVTEDARYLPLIYDFDSSGLVNARYALPAASLGIKKVTQRLYRGYCAHNPNLERARGSLLAGEEAIRTLFRTDVVSREKVRKKALKFLESSFSTLKNAKKFDKSIVRRCRG